MTLLSLALVTVYQQAESIINLIQQLYGLLSMPILSVFILGLAFKNVHAGAGLFSVIFGVVLYALLSFEFSPIHAPFGLHYIHLMFVTLLSCVTLSLLINWVVYKQRPVIQWLADNQH